MKKLIKIFLSLILIGCVLIFTSCGEEDDTIEHTLNFGTEGVIHEDTLSIGDTINFEFWLVNENFVSINEPIDVYCETFDNNGNLIAYMPIGATYNTNSSIMPGDSLFVNISEIISLSSYSVGDNVIVIWPASTYVSDPDTSLTSIYILN
ncbi:MAG: hypothetical protein CMP58_04790 [Flavobacteriales bacterium]|nr:hypothetical protein [Flavobacteriales bacterium]|tara:strand:+ start:171 stop:620 length:450 start_codon:yes stop_codon:yes gene_type:complete